MAALRQLRQLRQQKRIGGTGRPRQRMALAGGELGQLHEGRMGVRQQCQIREYSHFFQCTIKFKDKYGFFQYCVTARSYHNDSARASILCPCAVSYA
ncbi:MAG: hypothetical protein LBI48_00970 [Burkholderiaceae bacterium]|nr:hypothetical protein [Burkholderiaceae bacterium]